MSPLSELVWSPNEGLSIKIAASSLSTRKASLRWNADTLSIVISSPQHSGCGGKSGDNIDATLGDAEKMPSQLRTCSNSSMRVPMASPNRIRNLDAQQSTSIRSIRSPEQDSKRCGEINSMNEGREVLDNCCVDTLEKEEELGCCPTRCCKAASHSSASRKEEMHSIAETQVYCATAVHAERSWADNAWRARLVKAISQRDSVLPKNANNPQSPSSFGNLGDAENIPGKLTSFLGNKNDNLGDQVMQESHKDEPVVARCESASCVKPVARCEPASGVNPFPRCESASGVNSVAKYESTSHANPRKLEKGKEKVMYDQSNCVINTKEGDDSNESIESCPSTKAPKRRHVQCSAAEMPSGNKRFRREDNESSCTGLLHRNGSSFFNWMSSLTNGLTVFNETTAVPLDRKFSATKVEEFAARPLPLQNNNSIPLQSVGFNSLFQSIYSHNVMITSGNTYHQSESNCTERVPNRLMLSLKGSNSMLDKQISKGRENLDEATETSAADNNLQMGSGDDKGNFQNQIGIFPLKTERNLKLPNSSKSCSRSLVEKQNEFHASSSNAAMGNKCGFTESLWVSRFLPKTSMELMDATPCNVKRDLGAVDPKGIGDKLCCSSMQNFNMEKEFNNAQYFTSKGSDNGTSSKCPAMHPEEHKQSETMASIFAKRLDALRHAKTSAVRLAITCDHGMSNVCNHRTSSFDVSYSNHDGLEARQGTHKSSSGDGRLVLWIGDKGKEQLCTGNDEELRRNVLSEREHQQCGRSTTGKAVTPHDNLEANKSAEDIDGIGVKIKEGASNSMERLPDNKQIVPYGIMSSDVCDESSVVFGALQRLHLSRSDIIRWLRSPIMHTTLDGFFLRLRFGKWEEALGGTGYHVARINGALDRNRLSVTIRNSTCQVDSRFVSNHDFHEDELKAWWSAAVKGGWKLPSKEELNMKMRERELLHF